MPLFLKALPLSLKTFWRYLISLLFLMIAVYGFGNLLLFMPLGPLGALLALPFAVTVPMLFALVGFQCALTARQHYVEISIRRLLWISFVYLVLTAVITTLISLVGSVVGPPLDANLASRFPDSYFDGLATIIIGGLGPALFTLAMAVPMTAAIAAHPKRTDQVGLFWGFGSGVPSLALVWLVGIAASGFFFLSQMPALLSVFTSLGEPVGSGAFTNALAGIDLVSFAASGALAVWSSSWFFATAVLAWERVSPGRASAVPMAVKAPSISAEDLRALREARMPGTRSPPDKDNPHDPPAR